MKNKVKLEITMDKNLYEHLIDWLCIYNQHKKIPLIENLENMSNEEKLAVLFSRCVQYHTLNFFDDKWIQHLFTTDCLNVKKIE